MNAICFCKHELILELVILKRLGRQLEKCGKQICSGVIATEWVKLL